MKFLVEILRHDYFIVCLIASVVFWIAGKHKGFDGSKNWLIRYDIDPNKYFVFLLDSFLFAFIGGVFGVAIFNPSHLIEAIAAGLSWPMALGSLATTTS